MATVTTVFLVLTLFIAVCFSIPARHHYRNTAQEHVKYDQRQEGEFNVRADLENFVILLIPATPSVPNNSPSPSNPTLGLLDLLSKTIPLQKKQQHNKHVKKDGQDLQNPTTIESFLESKTAPYHVDIDGEENLVNVEKKTHPELNEAARRLAKAFVITVPMDVMKKDTKKDTKKKYESEMKLLGAENEQCGPGLSRDKDGICRVINKL